MDILFFVLTVETCARIRHSGVVTVRVFISARMQNVQRRTRVDLVGARARDVRTAGELTVFVHHQHVGEVRLRQHITPQHRSSSSVQPCNSTRLTRHIPVQRERRQCAGKSVPVCVLRQRGSWIASVAGK